MGGSSTAGKADSAAGKWLRLAEWLAELRVKCNFDSRKALCMKYNECTSYVFYRPVVFGFFSQSQLPCVEPIWLW